MTIYEKLNNGKDYYEIRLESIGGLGANLCGKMLGELGIQNTVSPTTIVANRILSYIRALDNSRGSNVLNLYRLVNNQVEALEFAVRKQSKIFDKQLKDIKLK